jgi:hypothetical protein
MIAIVVMSSHVSLSHWPKLGFCDMFTTMGPLFSRLCFGTVSVVVAPLRWYRLKKFMLLEIVEIGSIDVGDGYLEGESTVFESPEHNSTFRTMCNASAQGQERIT